MATRRLVLTRQSILLMGFSKYLLFADDSRFHPGLINGPYSEVSYHQCHIKSGSFLLVHFPPANLLFANLSITCFIISRNPAWDMFHQGSSGNLNFPVHCSIPSPSQSLFSLKHWWSFALLQLPRISQHQPGVILLISFHYVSHCIFLQAIWIATPEITENTSFLSLKTSIYTCDKES